MDTKQALFLANTLSFVVFAILDVSQRVAGVLTLAALIAIRLRSRLAIPITWRPTA